MANGKKKLNNRKNDAYSSYYSIVSFLGSLAYLIADIFVDDFAAAISAFVLLAISILACEIGIARLRRGLERNDPNAKKWKDQLSKIAQGVSYLSYPLLAFTLVFAMIANL